MSGNIDSHSNKRVLMIAANPGTSPTTGWPIGFWWAELTHPFWTFTEAGYSVEIVSPKGGDLVPKQDLGRGDVGQGDGWAGMETEMEGGEDLAVFGGGGVIGQRPVQ